MGLLLGLFSRQAGGGITRNRKVRVSDRLDFYVTAVAREADEPAKEPFVVDRNYQIITPGSVQKA